MSSQAAKRNSELATQQRAEKLKGEIKSLHVEAELSSMWSYAQQLQRLNFELRSSTSS
jgi:hypothetical protein